MDWLGALPEDERARLRPETNPEVLSPMLATLSRQHIERPGWIYERKLDGQRVVAFCFGGGVNLRSRTGKSANGAYPEIVDALAEQVGRDCVLDGEVVALEGDTTSFSRLQERMQQHNPEVSRRSSIPVVYFAFDMVHLEGVDIRNLPLLRRKALMSEALHFGDPIHRVAHVDDHGIDLLSEACAQGWEGLIAKRADSLYQTRRSADWLKWKCEEGQEFVIGGFTEPRGSRQEFGSLLLGYYDHGQLIYAGKVGTGFDHERLRAIGRQLRDLLQSDCPFQPHAALPRREVHWVQPQLVGQVAFTEWTTEGQLRHPRFLGLRDDKAADQVVRESARV